MRGIAMAIIGATFLWVCEQAKIEDDPPLFGRATALMALVADILWLIATLVVIAKGW